MAGMEETQAIPECGRPVKARDGTVVGQCNLTPMHLSKCAIVDWENASRPTVAAVESSS